MNWIRRIKQYGCYLFMFRKPIIRDMTCIDLVIGNKLLFLIAWETVCTGKLIIRPGRFIYRNSSGAAIVTLRHGTKEVKLKFSNYWRSIKVRVPLKLIELDNESFNSLNSDLKVFSAPSVVDLLPPRFLQNIQTKTVLTGIICFSPQININPGFNYQNLNRYEP
jgi:hypothetical protein